MPTSTDLVTDLPADFETFGQAVDTSLAELKGGTTGQVLSKTSNTDMDFTWVTSDDANAIQNTIVDAKGDLIAASASDVPARLAVGNNGETLVADSSTSTGLNYTATAGLNFCINGSLDFWQRGTSVSGAAVAPYYGADRWQVYRSGGVTGATFSRQDGTGAGFNYCYRIQRDNGNTSTNALFMSSSFETAISRNLQGQFLTLSFWARKGANYSPTDAVMKIFGGTGTDQNYANGFTSESTIASINIRATDLTTSWVRYTVTSGAAVSSAVTQIAIAAVITPVGTAGAADYVEFAGIKLEIGKAATAFSRAGETIQGELAACQRYYWRTNSASDGATPFGIGVAASSTAVDIVVKNPITMRIAPTSLDYAGLRTYDSVNAATVTSAVVNGTGIDNTRLGISVSSGLTQFRPYQLIGNSGSSYIGFSAEL